MNARLGPVVDTAIYRPAQLWLDGHRDGVNFSLENARARNCRTGRSVPARRA